MTRRQIQRVEKLLRAAYNQNQDPLLRVFYEDDNLDDIQGPGLIIVRPMKRPHSPEEDET